MFVSTEEALMELAAITEAFEKVRAERREVQIDELEISEEISKNELEQIRVATRNKLGELRTSIKDTRRHYLITTKLSGVCRLLMLLVILNEAILLIFATNRSVIMALGIVALAVVGALLGYVPVLCTIRRLCYQYLTYGELEAVIIAVDYRGIERTTDWSKPII